MNISKVCVKNNVCLSEPIVWERNGNRIMWNLSTDKGRAQTCSCTKSVPSKHSRLLHGQCCCKWNTTGDLYSPIRKTMGKSKKDRPRWNSYVLFGDGHARFVCQECCCWAKPITCCAQLLLPAHLNTWPHTKQLQMLSESHPSLRSIFCAMGLRWLRAK